MALEGVKVIEWGEYVSAPFCARTLADMGADVLKVEHPRGDRSRRHGPFPGDVPHREQSGLYLALNANKRGITLNPSKATGRAILLRLLESADVLVEDQGASFVDGLGLDYVSLKERFPRLIVASLTPYGRTGPYRDYKGHDLSANAAGGISFGNGTPQREPLVVPAAQVSFMAGLGAALATVMALVAREATGRGQLVDVAEAQVVGVLLTGYHLPTYIYKGIPGYRAGNRFRLGLYPNCVLPCKDGYVCINCPQMEQYQRFLALLGNPEWTNNPRYRDRRAMTEQYPDEAEGLIIPWFMEHTKEEIFALCREHRIPCVPVQTIQEVVHDEHLASRSYFQELGHPDAGRLTYPGPPYRFSATPWGLRLPAPTLGQHNREVLCDLLGYIPDDLPRLRAAGVI
ncbi:MAG: CoA transferase [Chloroflexi bacterium]|nr:CoA transferase [Chloroflexota bacterium]